jgi:N utilization substance protein B
MSLPEGDAIVNVRRTARELALKVLYQMDVGKQPLPEALEGALEQVRTQVYAPMTQVVHDTQASLRRLYTQLPSHQTPQDIRQIRQLATLAAMQIQNLAEMASEQVRALTRHPPTIDPASAKADLLAAIENARSQVQQMASRPGSRPEIAEKIQEAFTKASEHLVEVYNKHLPTVQQIADFLILLVHGVQQARQEIDMRLAALSTGWGLERQAAVDRNIMRLAAYEILYLPDIPTGASINEAVELAKKFSTAESGRFVNGVLGTLAARARGAG